MNKGWGFSSVVKSKLLVYFESFYRFYAKFVFCHYTVIFVWYLALCFLYFFSCTCSAQYYCLSFLLSFLFIFSLMIHVAQYFGRYRNFHLFCHVKPDCTIFLCSVLLLINFQIAETVSFICIQLSSCLKYQYKCIIFSC